MKKIAVGLLTTLLLVCMLPFSAFASSGGIATYADLCLSCGQGEMRRQTPIYSDWHWVDVKLCEHGHPLAVDKIEERTVTIVYKCDGCGIEIVNEHTEKQIICTA